MWEKLENIRNIANIVQIVEESLYLCGTNSVWINRILGMIVMERERKFSGKTKEMNETNDTNETQEFS